MESHLSTCSNIEEALNVYNECKYVKYDCANLHAFIKKITQRFCTNSTPLLGESLRKTNQHRVKMWSDRATQACKQRLWLPLWLPVSLTALLIHLRHKRQQTHAARSYQVIIKNILFHVFPHCYRIMTFEGKRLKVCDPDGQTLKEKSIPVSSGLGCALCNFSRCLLPCSFSLLLHYLNKSLSHTHTSTPPVWQTGRQNGWIVMEELRGPLCVD